MAAPTPDEVRKLNEDLKEQMSSLSGINQKQADQRVLAQQISNIQAAIAEHTKEAAKGVDASKKAVIELNVLLEEQIKEQEQINAKLERSKKLRQGSVDLARKLGSEMKGIYNWMMQADKSIRSTNLQLGLSGTKAAAMRQSFEESAVLVTRLGGSMEDIGNIMTTYADETGRAHVLTSSMVENITLIGKGTGLGIEQAAKLGAQFEFMGFDAKATMDYVQGVVDTSERMGVNTTKVLKTVSDNFKELSTFTFQGGVASFAKMAQSAEKTRVSMETALSVAEATRGLQNVIDLGAQLQVMGGEFAKMDPFQWLYMVRNEPDKLTEKISEMTTGMYTLKKATDGTFEKFISPADRDRLAQVAKSLGIAKNEMFEIAQRRLDFTIMDKQMAGMGLTDREKELIQGAAKMNKDTGRFQVSLGDTLKNIGTLTKEQAQSFIVEQESLEKRAKQAQTFDDAFKAIIESLKSILLPMLQGVNQVLEKVRPFVEKGVDGLNKFTKNGIPGMIKAFGIAMGVGALIVKGILPLVMNAVRGVQFLKTWKGSKGIAGGIGGGITGGIPATGKGSSGLALQRAGIGQGAAAKGAGMKSLGKGVGAGAAMAGAGAGIMLAAKGLSELADSMSKLTPEQAESLERIAITMAVTFPLAAIGIALAGSAAAATAPGLLALGAAMLMIGGAVGIAAAGIGVMGKGLGEMFENVKGAGPEMMQAATGVMGIAIALGAATLTLPTAIGLGFAFNRMAKNADKLTMAGDALKNIKEGLTGSAQDYERIARAVNMISKAKLKRNSALEGLADIMTKPLKVEFDRQKVNLQNDVTLLIDGEKFMNKVYNVDLAVQARENRRNNK